jgi:hypothetical protein
MSFIKKLFKCKKAEDYPKCFICGERDANVQCAFIEIARLHYYFHKDCVKDVICHAEDLPINMTGILYTSVEIVNSLKKEEKRKAKFKEEMKVKLQESKEYFSCDKED